MLDSLLWAFVVTLLSVPFLAFLRERPVPLTESGAVSLMSAPDGGGGRPPYADPPALHEVPGDVAEFVIPDFRPGTDLCRIALNDPDAEFDAIADDFGVRLLFLDGGSYLEVAFPGLGVPPFEDVVILAPDGTEMRLSDLVGSSQRHALRPVRSRWAELQGFSADRECVEIWVSPDAAVLPDVAVRPSADGQHGEIVIDGRLAARLCGAPDADQANVLLLRKAPPAPSGAAKPSARVQSSGLTS